MSTVDHIAPTSLVLQWKPVPREFVHGVLTGYKVQYRAVEQGERNIWSKAFEMNVPGHVNKVKVTNLTSYTRYQFTVLAKTKVGNGVASEPMFGGQWQLCCLLVI